MVLNTSRSSKVSTLFILNIIVQRILKLFIRKKMESMKLNIVFHEHFLNTCVTITWFTSIF